MNPMQSPNTGVGRGLYIESSPAPKALTQDEFRHKFAVYFLDLKEETERDGGYVNKQREWESFVTHAIAEGTIPPVAYKWKCPRSLKGL